MEDLDLKTLRLACYIGQKSFWKGKLKTAKKRNDLASLEVLEDVGRIRKWLEEDK